jgi:oligopeptide/dipeptide ABC transporter ATP-binding protein
VLDAPRHPYTQALLRAAPSLEPPPPGARRGGAAALTGELPSPLAIPPGCPFHPRCKVALVRCATEVPRVHVAGDAHFAECHLVE